MTTTSYAILGLLAIRDWTTYELVRQVDRTLRRFWPRAQSKLYEEPKKLVALGYARATEEHVGRRRRTRYRITPQGRRALSAWLQEPSAGPALEFEQLVKIHFADSGSTADVRAHLDDALAWVREQNEENLEAGRAYLAGRGEFEERSAINFLSGRFLTDYYAMVGRWAEWARRLVDDWPDDVRDAQVDPAEREVAVALAEEIARIGSVARRDYDGIEKSGRAPKPKSSATGRRNVSLRSSS